MRTRALMSVVLMAAWLSPLASGACLADARTGGDGHADATTESSHAERAHGHQVHADAEHDHAGPARHGSEAPGSGGSRCCCKSSQPPAAKLSTLDPNPRPTGFIVLVTTFRALPAVECSDREAAFRRRQPPPLPYAHTHRPLLI